MAATPKPEGTPVGRRVVLGMLGLGAAGVVVGKQVQSGVAALLEPVTSRDPTGITQLIPGSGGFRIYAELGSPSRSDADYALTVDGLVDSPRTYRLDDLRERLPQTRLVKDFQCVTGWRVPGVHWQGVKLSDLLDEVGVKPQARAVHFHSFDGGYTETLTLDQARRPDVIAAHRMLGAPVTQEHGGPVRLYVAAMYGYKSAKWLERIEVTDSVDPIGYWEEQGYDVDAWVGRSNGRTDEEIH